MIVKHDFHLQVLFPNIKELVLYSIPIEQLWHDQLPILSFGVQNLTSLELKRCHNLKNLFTSSMVKSFVQLKTLRVVNCDKIEEVIIITEGLVEEERMRKMVFPKLDYLFLINLPNLKRFCSGNPIEFPFLRKLRIKGCRVLNTFHSDSTSVGTIVGNEAGKSSISMENLHMDVPKYLFNEKVFFFFNVQLPFLNINFYYSLMKYIYIYVLFSSKGYFIIVKLKLLKL